MIATEKHYAFRGRLMSLLVLTHCGVSSRPLLPQESPCFSYASISLLITDSGGNSNIKNIRSEEHTSELQSRGHHVCSLLLEKKNKKYKYMNRDRFNLI